MWEDDGREVGSRILPSVAICAANCWKGIHYLARVGVFFGLAKPHRKKFAKILYAPPSPPIPPPPPYNSSTIRVYIAQHERVRALLDNEVPAKTFGSPVHPPVGYSTVLMM